jgi:hypothetical protein
MRGRERDRIGCQPPICDLVPLDFADEPCCLTAPGAEGTSRPRSTGRSSARTGVLSYFKPDDHAQLTRLGVRVICDLRRAEERELEPTRWPGGNTQHLSGEDGSAPPTIHSVAANHSHPHTAAGMHAAMIDLYRELPSWMAPRRRGIFSRIARGEVPVLVHCARRTVNSPDTERPTRGGMADSALCISEFCRNNTC